MAASTLLREKKLQSLTSKSTEKLRKEEHQNPRHVNK